MAITRLWQTSFEENHADIADGGSWGRTFSNPRTGSVCADIQQAVPNKFFQVNVPATRQIRLGTSIYGTEFSPSDGQLIMIRESGGSWLVELRYGGKPADGYSGPRSKLQLYVGGAQKGYSADALLSDRYYHIAIDCKIDSSAGWVNFYLNGILFFSFSGNTGNDDIDNVLFGTSWDMGAADWRTRYDDPYIDDTTGEGSPTAPPPILRFYRIAPNGAGNYTQWTPSAGANYQCVDEVPPNTGDYVITDVVDELDSYALGDQTLLSGQEIKAIIAQVYAKNTTGTEDIALGTRYSGVDVIGSDQQLGTSYDFYFERQTTKPGGGAWDQASLNGHETVIKSRGF
ncbi:MAG: hypothetical protein ACYTFW_00360 [Planctomycetota bacterium]|jgi:hypothetical protein